MLDAAQEATSFIVGRSVEDLAHDRLLLLALVKEIELVGEAAAQISAEVRDSSPEIPWAKIKGMRNRLIHAYSDVNTELVWSTVVADLPDFVESLKRLLANDPTPLPPLAP